jgi:hypothetical protein
MDSTMADTFIRLEGAARTRDRPRNVMETGKPCSVLGSAGAAWTVQSECGATARRDDGVASRGYLLMQ